MVKFSHILHHCANSTAHNLTQPFQRMLSLVFGPRPERQELCAALDIPLAPALREECDCQVVSIVEVARMSSGVTA